jgi:hypothetical protein
MKLLFLSQGYTVEDQVGWDHSFQRLVTEGFVKVYDNLPARGYVKNHGWPMFYNRVIELHAEKKYDVIYFQFFHGLSVPRKDTVSPQVCIETLRKIYPQVVILTSAGDPFSVNWLRPDYPYEFRECARCADIVFSTQMGKAADIMLRRGAKNVVLSPLAMCPARFKACHINPHTHPFEFDVVFIGNCNKSRLFNPLNNFSYAARKRTKLVKALSKHFGKRFGLFGRGWDGVLPNQGPIHFSQQQNTFQRGRLTVGAYPYSMADYYASDRPFFSIPSGIPTIEIATPRLDRILRNNDHCYFCHSVDDVITTCDRLLQMDQVELYARASKAADYIAERHTQYHRAKVELEIAIRYRDNGRKLDIIPSLFLEEINAVEEKRFAVRSIV